MVGRAVRAAERPPAPLNVPEIAENGNIVPIDVAAPGTVEIRVLSDYNPHSIKAAAGGGRIWTRRRWLRTMWHSAPR